MTTYTSAAAGDWRTPATWGVGSGYPVAGDTANIGHAVTTSNDEAATIVDVITNGMLTLGGNLTISTDSTSGYVRINDDALGFTAGTVERTITASHPLARKWRFIIETKVADTRTINLDYLKCVDSLPTISVAANYYHMNYGTTASATYLSDTYVTYTEPNVGAPKLEYHSIAGRNGGRTYKNGNESGRMVIHGFTKTTPTTMAKFRTILEASYPVSFVGWEHHLVRGYVEDMRFKQKAGSDVAYFDMYLVEDL